MSHFSPLSHFCHILLLLLRVSLISNLLLFTHRSSFVYIYILFTLNSSRSISSLPTQSYSSFLLFIMLGSLPKISSQMILIQFCIYLFTIFKSLFFLFLYLTCSNYTCLCMFTVTIIPIIRISLLFH